jgi:hypothetical protein
LDLAVAKEGTIQLPPDAVFYLLGLVDRIGKLKGKAEIYYKISNEIAEALGKTVVIELGTGKTLDSNARIDEINDYVRVMSENAGPGSKLNLMKTFPEVANGKFQDDVFVYVQKEAEKLMHQFWIIDPIQFFITGSENAWQYWSKAKEESKRR